MELIIKKFNRLTAEELFKIYKVRVAVFVVEQNCPYQEVDDTDKESLHVWVEENGEIQAYLRIFEKDKETNTMQIGRVLSVVRGVGLGNKIIKSGIDRAKNILKADSIFIEAQTYALPFYEKAGFVTCGDEFLEDGIPHTPMTLILKTDN